MLKKSLYFFFFLFALIPSAHADITVALVAPLTGSSAIFGEQISHGAEQAVKDINAKGGVLGQKLVLKKYDDACDPKQAVAVANRIAGENIKFAIVHFCSGAGLAAMKTFMENEILAISPAISHPDFTEKADTFIFRAALRGDAQGKAIADYILKHFKDKNVAILNDKSAFGAMIAENVKKDLNAAGKQEILYDSYSVGEKDYAPIISLLKQKQADIVAIGGYHTEGALITRQMRQQGMKTAVIGPAAFISRELWSITGDAGDGVLMVFGPDPRKRPIAKEAVASLKKSGFEPEGFTIYAYGATQAVAQGITDAGNTNTRDVAAALRKGTYHTVLGDLRFDAKGDVQKPEIVVYKWHNGDYAEIK